MRTMRVHRPWGRVLAITCGPALLAMESVTSGAGWLEVLAAILAGLGLVAFVAPALCLWWTCRHLSVSRTAIDAQVGVAFRVGLAPIALPVLLQPVEPKGVAQLVRGHDCDWQITPARRGPLHRASAVAATAFPFGLFWWSRRIEMALPPEVVVAPRPTQVSPGAVASAATNQSWPLLREMVPSDSVRAIHWSTSARLGRPVVLQMPNGGATAPHILVVHLDGTPQQVEQQAADYFGQALQALQRSSLRMSVRTPTGRHEHLVTSVVAAGRLLGMAVPG